jgi:tryptophan synthase alpha chain
MNGIDHISQTFDRLHAAGRAALMPYYTMGYPDRSVVDIIEAIARSGADLLELGIPFSDPLADGPTIQRSTQVALANGMRVAGCLEGVRRLRQRGVVQPLLLMGYYNPILAYGVEAFVADAAAAGADGFIVPDLPPEEADEMESACRVQGMALPYRAPTFHARAYRPGSLPPRVFVPGPGDRRDRRPPAPAARPGGLRPAGAAAASLPHWRSALHRDSQHAQQVAALADGVIVGSALINAVMRMRLLSGG